MKMQIGKIPYPLGSVSHYDLDHSTAPAAIPGFQIDTFAELGGGFNGTSVGGGIRVPEGVAFRVPGGLREDASQFDFPGVGGLVFHFAFSALRLGHGNSGTVHLDIED